MLAWLAENPGSPMRSMSTLTVRPIVVGIRVQALALRASKYAEATVIVPSVLDKDTGTATDQVTLADTGKYKVMFDIAGDRKDLYNGKSGSKREAALAIAFIPTDSGEDAADDAGSTDDTSADDTAADDAPAVADTTEPGKGKKSGKVAA